MESKLLRKIERSLDALKLHLPKSKIALALSGGLDSMVLLHLLLKLSSQKGFDLVAFHIDHQLRDESSSEAAAIKDCCDELGVVCRVHKLPVASISDLKEMGIEAWARKRRYAALQDLASQESANIIATAHHLQDHRENFWMRLFEGKAIELCGRFCGNKNLGNALLWRPLLKIEKKQLLSFSKEFGVLYFEDASNQNLCIRRNLLRRKIMPTLTQLWPLSFDRITDSLLEQSCEIETLYRRRTLPLGRFTRTWWGGLLWFPFAQLLPCEWVFVLREAKKSGIKQDLGLRSSVVQELLRQRKRVLESMKAGSSGYWYSASDEERDTWTGWVNVADDKRSYEPLYYLDCEAVSQEKESSWKISECFHFRGGEQQIDFLASTALKKEGKHFRVCSDLPKNSDWIGVTLVHRCFRLDRKAFELFCHMLEREHSSISVLTGKERLLLGFLFGRLTLYFRFDQICDRSQPLSQISASFSIETLSQASLAAESSVLHLKEIRQILAKAKVAPKLRGLFPCLKRSAL